MHLVSTTADASYMLLLFKSLAIGFAYLPLIESLDVNGLVMKGMAARALLLLEMYSIVSLVGQALLTFVNLCLLLVIC